MCDEWRQILHVFVFPTSLLLKSQVGSFEVQSLWERETVSWRVSEHICFRLYSTINVFLILQSMLGHSVALYVILDMLFNGFYRKFISRFPNVLKIVVDKGFRYLSDSFLWTSIYAAKAVCRPYSRIHFYPSACFN